MGLVKELQKQGFDVLAIAPEDEFSEILKKEGCTFIPLTMENKGSNPLKDLQLIRQLYTIYKANQPDIVLQYTIKPNIYGSIAAKLAGIPVINNVSGLGTVFLHNNLVSKVAKGLYKFAFRYPKKIFFQNPEDLQLFVQEGLIKKERAGLVPGSGVNLDKFKPAEFQRNNPFTFLLIARLLYDKGLMEFAEAARILKKSNSNCRVQVIGALDPGPLGIPEETLNQWIKDGLMEYIPFQKDIRSFIASSDCVVLPSYREGTPKTLLEAAAMGKPLIATDVPGCREVIDDGKNGFLCEVKNGKDLADKMLKMCQLDHEALKRMGENSRKLVLLKYDEKIVIRKYLEVINEVVPGIVKLDLV
jgi:glycosyltransferase involved in cell wall biosynthesis